MRAALTLLVFLCIISCKPTATEPDYASILDGQYKISRYEYPALGYPLGYKLTYDTTVTLRLKRVDKNNLDARFTYDETKDWLRYNAYNGTWSISHVDDLRIDLVCGSMGYTYSNKQIDIVVSENGPYVSLRKIGE